MSNMWIEPRGTAHEVGDHYDFVAEWSGLPRYDEGGDTSQLAEESDNMLNRGWIRVVDAGGGMMTGNDIGFQGRLDAMIKNKWVIDSIILQNRRDTVIVEIIRPTKDDMIERGSKSFYIPYEEAAHHGFMKSLMRQRIADGVSLTELRRRPPETRIRMRYTYSGPLALHNREYGRIVAYTGEVAGEETYIVQLDSGEEVRVGESRFDVEQESRAVRIRRRDVRVRAHRRQA